MKYRKSYRRSSPGVPLALAALLSLLAPALVRAEPGAEFAAESTVTDVLDRQVPGREANESLKRTLTVPSSTGRSSRGAGSAARGAGSSPGAGMLTA